VLVGGAAVLVGVLVAVLTSLNAGAVAVAETASGSPASWGELASVQLIISKEAAMSTKKARKVGIIFKTCEICGGWA
jgi:hypothetical protein